MNKTKLVPLIVAGLVMSTNASAALYGGVEFPEGAVSFADAVVDFSPVIKANQPAPQHLIPGRALGIPDDPSGTSAGAGYVSLGDGGSITLQFTDNSLTGSGNSDDDLWVFEVGSDTEDTFVEISKDNSTWFSVGALTGSTQGIDIDFFGFGLLFTVRQIPFNKLTPRPPHHENLSINYRK